MTYCPAQEIVTVSTASWELTTAVPTAPAPTCAPAVKDGLVTVTVATAKSVGSALLVTVTVITAGFGTTTGAVYKPFLSIWPMGPEDDPLLPPPLLAMAHVT